jgi:P pilus assembly chaperone PapD
VKTAKSMVLIGVSTLAWIIVPGPAHAELVLSELIVDLQPGKQSREDVEVWNNSPERSFVSIDPREIVDAGMPSQRDRRDPDPENLGLLVAPARMILEAGQRRLVRFANLSASPDREHVYRVTIKPTVGALKSAESGLKVVVGYDVLVLIRPVRPTVNVIGARNGRKLTFKNSGNVSVEVVEGQQCSNGHACTSLPGKRLYPNAAWTLDLPADLPVSYTLRSAGQSQRRTY